MTHSLHRRGIEESLKKDYVVLAIAAQGVNAKGSAAKMKEFYDIVSKYNYKNLGDMRTGNIYSVGLDVIVKGFQDNSVVHVVLTNRSEVLRLLKELKEKDLGLSIVVSGLIEDVKKMCQESGSGIEFHTVNNSLGIWGKTERLPEENVIQINTMCGHGMVSYNLIENLVEKVKKGRKNIDDAVKEICKQCHCGLVNPNRTKELLEEML